MDDRNKKSKSHKKQLNKNRTPLLKPDMMLITKDVMVPVKLTSLSEKFYSTPQISSKKKLGIPKVSRLSNQALKPILNSDFPSKNYFEPSTVELLSKKLSPQTINDITPTIKVKQAVQPKSPLYCLPRNSALNNKLETQLVSLEEKKTNSASSSSISDVNKRAKSNIDLAVKLREADETLILSSKNSMSSVTTSLETLSCYSSKSLKMIEESLPKLPSNIISSSESDNNIPYFPKNSIARNYNMHNNDNTIGNFDSNVGHKLRLQDQVQKISKSQEDAVEYAVDTKDQMMNDVKYLLESLITNVHTLMDLNNYNEYVQSTPQNSSFFDDEKASDNEQRPKMVELRYSSQNLASTVYNEDSNIDLKKKYSWQLDQGNDQEPGIICNNYNDINSDQSEEKIEIKYSWQKISKYNSEQNLSLWSESREMKLNNRNKINVENNSKQTFTEDLYLNKPEFQYSWQKLTSKYLVDNYKQNQLVNAGQPVRTTNDISVNTINTESTNDSFPIKENCRHSFNLISSHSIEKKNKINEDIVGRVAVNSPLNNVISSMLPDIKVSNWRNNFDNFPVSSSRFNSNKPCTSHSSVSSIKHVIDSLNKMVTTQKNIFDTHIRNQRSDNNSVFMKSELGTNPTFKTLERVEIFPSTLHVLGDYIIKDIHSMDMNVPKNLLNVNDHKIVHEHSLSDKLTNVQSSVSPDKQVKNTLNEKIPSACTTPAISEANSTRLSFSSSQLLLDGKDADFSSMLSYPISFVSDPYSSILTSDYFSSKSNNLQKHDEAEMHNSNKNRNSPLLPFLEYDYTLADKNQKTEITDMDQTIGPSLDSTCSNKGKNTEHDDSQCTKIKSPLKPRVQVSFSEIKDAGDSSSRKDELQTRLESAMSRLKQCEQQVDADWNLDYSVIDIEKSTSEKETVQLPEQVEEHMKDIVKSAEEYLTKLEVQLRDLRNADDQIINSSERTLKEIDETYKILMDNLCREINKRRNLVRLETEVFKYEGLVPLRACKQEVDAQIRSTQHLITLTETMLTKPFTFNKERLGKIITATSHMGRIPAVPMPEELPYVTFSPPNEDLKKEIIDRISCLGCVLRMGPAQFTEVCERPTCLQLKWHIVDPEFTSEEQTFIVQKALGEITEPTSQAFETVYIGPETSCFVRELPVNHPITLRVGIQVSDTAWSVHRIAQTSIPAYSWDMSNSDYLITNNGRIATKVTQNISTLLSRGPQFSVDHIIEFKFLEAASGSNEEGIGLVYEPLDVNENLKRNGALLITPNGNIFMDGEEKLMQLPKMQLGTRIIFTSEQKDDDTLRMTIECGNKAVTYDWTVQRPLHFAARFVEHNKWNFMVK